MKKIISLIIVLTMVLSLAACQKKESGEDNSLKYIQDKGKLILGLDDSFPPMGYRNENNEIVGFDIDLAKAVCEKLGVELVLQPISWEAKEQELNTKNIDCIWNGLSVTPERQKNMNMSMSYMSSDITLVVSNGSDIKTMSDMSGKRLALQSGSAAEETLNSEENKDFKASLSEIIPFDDYETAMMDLESGNSDAILMDSVMANYKITEGGKDFVVLNETLFADQYAIGFRKGDDALSNAVNDVLKELKEDGTIKEISTKWFGSDITIIK